MILGTWTLGGNLRGQVPCAFGLGFRVYCRSLLTKMV